MNHVRRNANLIALSAAAAAALLYYLPPQQHSFYPSCPVYRYLHVYCPGCGSTRALAALLHGRFLDAAHYNPLFVALLPVLLLMSAAFYWRAAARGEVRWPQLPKPALLLFLLTAAAFTVVRNV
jgi:hypothetical protein